jgi:hypothetical protein
MTEDFFDRVERERKIAGTRPGESPKVRYVSFEAGKSPSKEFLKVTRALPRIAKRGGVMRDDSVITLPGGAMFFPFIFHDDVEGWQRQIEGGARALGRCFAWIEGDNFVVSDGRSVPLSACKVMFD